MRITVHIDTFDRVDPGAYAILWLDDALLEWSREAHANLPLPSWGRLQRRPSATLVCLPDGANPIFELEGLELHKHGGPFEGETGVAWWFARDGANPESGHWHVQCIDDQPTEAESSIFADDNA